MVDADYLVYSCGFAAEKTMYDVSVERPDGTIGETIVRYMDEVKAFLSDEPMAETAVVEPLVHAEPLQNALFLVSRVLTGVDSRLTELGVDFDELELYLTGKGNFRDSLATIKGYKANRIDSRKPVHYKSIRRYLTNRWGAKVVDGYEADDAVAMLAAQYDYDPSRLIIVSLDKDLRTVPGGHYHFKRRTLEVLTHEDALVNFYRQLLTGDTVDNIGGCFKCGEKKAAKLVHHGMTEQEMYEACLNEFKASVERKGCPYAGMDPASALLENARLLHMLRKPNDVWLPPAERSSTDLGSSKS